MTHFIGWQSTNVSGLLTSSSMTLNAGLFHDGTVDSVSALDGTSMEDPNSAVDSSRPLESWAKLG